MTAEFSADTRAIAYAQAHGMCEVCGVGLMDDDFHAHHRQKRRHGRADIANILVVCAVSHDWIHKSEKAAATLGYIVPSWTDPASVPVRWPDQTWRTPVGRLVVAT